jgi:hypothetical protein
LSDVGGEMTGIGNPGLTSVLLGVYMDSARKEGKDKKGYISGRSSRWVSKGRLTLDGVSNDGVVQDISIGVW